MRSSISICLLAILSLIAVCHAYTGTARLTEQGPSIEIRDKQMSYHIELLGIDVATLAAISTNLRFAVTDSNNVKKTFVIENEIAQSSVKSNALITNGQWNESDESFIPRELRRSAPAATPRNIPSNTQSSNRATKQSVEHSTKQASPLPASSTITQSTDHRPKPSFGSSRSIPVEASSPLSGYPEGVQPLLTLVMIVKNEASGLQQTLDSTFGFIDHYSIVDTGSTDDTIDIINNFYARLPSSVTHALHSEPFVDFSTTRNRALFLAGNSTEFVLMMNGDDRLVGGDEMRAFLETRRGMTAIDEAIYIIPIDYGGRASGRSERLARTSNHFVPNWPNDDYNHWRFEGVTHEAYVCNAALYSGARIIYTEGNFGIYHDITNDTPDKKNSRFELDIELLLKDIEAHPDSLNMPRNVYYLAQSYYNLEDFDNARQWYQRRVEINYIRPTPKGEDNEKHRAYSILAWIAEKKHEPADAVERLWKLSYDACPAAWSVYNLANFQFTQGNIDRAKKLVDKARKILVKGSPVICAGDDPAVQSKLPGLISAINEAVTNEQS